MTPISINTPACSPFSNLFHNLEEKHPRTFRKRLEKIWDHISPSGSAPSAEWVKKAVDSISFTRDKRLDFLEALAISDHGTVLLSNYAVEWSRLFDKLSDETNRRFLRAIRRDLVPSKISEIMHAVTLACERLGVKPEGHPFFFRIAKQRTDVAGDDNQPSSPAPETEVLEGSSDSDEGFLREIESNFTVSQFLKVVDQAALACNRLEARRKDYPKLLELAKSVFSTVKDGAIPKSVYGLLATLYKDCLPQDIVREVNGIKKQGFFAARKMHLYSAIAKENKKAYPAAYKEIVKVAKNRELVELAIDFRISSQTEEHDPQIAEGDLELLKALHAYEGLSIVKKRLALASILLKQTTKKTEAEWAPIMLKLARDAISFPVQEIQSQLPFFSALFTGITNKKNLSQYTLLLYESKKMEYQAILLNYRTHEFSKEDRERIKKLLSSEAALLVNRETLIALCVHKELVIPALKALFLGAETLEQLEESLALYEKTNLDRNSSFEIEKSLLKEAVWPKITSICGNDRALLLKKASRIFHCINTHEPKDKPPGPLVGILYDLFGVEFHAAFTKMLLEKAKDNPSLKSVFIHIEYATSKGTPPWSVWKTLLTQLRTKRELVPFVRQVLPSLVRYTEINGFAAQKCTLSQTEARDIQQTALLVLEHIEISVSLYNLVVHLYIEALLSKHLSGEEIKKLWQEMMRCLPPTEELKESAVPLFQLLFIIRNASIQQAGKEWIPVEALEFYVYRYCKALRTEVFEKNAEKRPLREGRLLVDYFIKHALEFPQDEELFRKITRRVFSMFYTFYFIDNSKGLQFALKISQEIMTAYGESTDKRVACLLRELVYSNLCLDTANHFALEIRNRPISGTEKKDSEDLCVFTVGVIERVAEFPDTTEEHLAAMAMASLLRSSASAQKEKLYQILKGKNVSFLNELKLFLEEKPEFSSPKELKAAISKLRVYADKQSSCIEPLHLMSAVSPFLKNFAETDIEFFKQEMEQYLACASFFSLKPQGCIKFFELWMSIALHVKDRESLFEDLVSRLIVQIKKQMHLFIENLKKRDLLEEELARLVIKMLPGYLQCLIKLLGEAPYINEKGIEAVKSVEAGFNEALKLPYMKSDENELRCMWVVVEGLARGRYKGVQHMDTLWPLFSEKQKKVN